MTPSKRPVWPVAVGNHRVGYVGRLRTGRGPDDPDAYDVWSCSHRHPTTDAARDCAWGRLARL